VQIPPSILSSGATPPTLSAQNGGAAEPQVDVSSGTATQASETSPASNGSTSKGSTPKRPQSASQQTLAATIPLDNARKLSPDDQAAAQYDHARDLYGQGKTEQAIAEAKEILKKRPSLDEPHLLVAAAALQKQDYKTAEQELQVVRNQTQLYALLVAGAIQLGQGKTQDAIATFQKAAQAASNNSAALYDLGLAHQQNNNFSQAQQYYQAALAQNPNFPEAHHNLGTVLLQTAGPNAAFQEFHAATMANPSDPTLASDLSLVSQQINATGDSIAGTWALTSGVLKISGTANGQPISQTIQMPASSQISITKGLNGGYQATESAGGFQQSITLQQQSDGSYRAPAVVPAEVASLLPPGVTDQGTITFWTSGSTLFGDTKETVIGPNTQISIDRNWEAARAGRATSTTSGSGTASSGSNSAVSAGGAASETTGATGITTGPSTNTAPSTSDNQMWQVQLQQERLKALSHNDMALYNKLVEKDRSIYQQHGVDPCNSSYFQGGCQP
jgi:Flp pilus assembly protein TadD